jgi:hypothetical protein
MQFLRRCCPRMRRALHHAYYPSVRVGLDLPFTAPISMIMRARPCLDVIPRLVDGQTDCAIIPYFTEIRRGYGFSNVFDCPEIYQSELSSLDVVGFLFFFHVFLLLSVVFMLFLLGWSGPRFYLIVLYHYIYIVSSIFFNVFLYFY